MGDSVQEKIGEMKDWLIEVRRTIHMNPELGFEEVETSKLVVEWLEKLGLQVTKGVARTGVVGLLQGEKAGKTVAIRADMDALPLEEATQVPYRSRAKGRMHACGHDGHVTILLGVARLFSSIQEQVKGNIKWIFQPAEEGGGGGRIMVEEGVLENPKVDAIFAAHLYPDLRTGEVGIYEREGFAAIDQFVIKLLGKGGHVALPHLSRDPIYAAGHLIAQVYSIASQSINPLDSAVVAIGKVSGGTTYNIIPDEVELLGTVRSLTSQVRERLKSRLEKVTQGVARSFELDYQLDYQYGYPALLNHPEMSHLVTSACARGVGKEKIKFLRPSMGGEDFAYYLEKIPGSYFRLGCRNEGNEVVYPLHNSRFDIDEDVLPFGVEMFTRIIDQYLGLQLF